MYIKGLFLPFRYGIPFIVCDYYYLSNLFEEIVFGIFLLTLHQKSFFYFFYFSMKTYFSPKNFPHYVSKAQHSIQDVIRTTPLQINEILSQEYQANIFLKREDMQAVRSYKIRGAYFMISNLSEVERNYGVVCASAGNHAQGVAFSCHNLGIK